MTEQWANSLAESLVENVGKWEEQNDCQVENRNGYEGCLAWSVHLEEGVHW